MRYRPILVVGGYRPILLVWGVQTYRMRYRSILEQVADAAVIARIYVHMYSIHAKSQIILGAPETSHPFPPFGHYYNIKKLILSLRKTVSACLG